jgi:hypothetical protein
MSGKKILPVLLVTLIMFSACENLLRSPTAPQWLQSHDDKVVVNISILNNQARSVLPDLSANQIDAYRLFGVRTNETGPEILLTSFSGHTASISLAPGTWNFTLEAYIGDKPVLRGMARDIPLSVGGANNIGFVLRQLDSGEGSISITINFPAGADITRITVRCDGEDLPDLEFSGNNATFFAPIKNAGTYFYSFRLFSGDRLRTVVSETVLVRGNLTSQKTINLGPADLNPLNTEERFVRANMAEPGDGLSWETATDDLQKMIDEVHFALRTGAEKAIVHVAAGTYTPKYWPKEDGTTDYDFEMEEPSRTLRDRMQPAVKS